MSQIFSFHSEIKTKRKTTHYLIFIAVLRNGNLKSRCLIQVPVFHFTEGLYDDWRTKQLSDLVIRPVQPMYHVHRASSYHVFSLHSLEHLKYKNKVNTAFLKLILQVGTTLIRIKYMIIFNNSLFFTIGKRSLANITCNVQRKDMISEVVRHMFEYLFSLENQRRILIQRPRRNEFSPLKM